MLKIYGSMLCPDCVDCCRDLDTAGVSYEFLDFGVKLKALKEFLAIRDKDPMFDSIRAAGSIGIPMIIREDGSMTFDWLEYVSQAEA